MFAGKFQQCEDGVLCLVGFSVVVEIFVFSCVNVDDILLKCFEFSVCGVPLSFVQHCD